MPLKMMLGFAMFLIWFPGCFWNSPERTKSKGEWEIIAHRGASEEAPENTLASVRRAWELGADAAEVDVHLSRDGRVMVHHDKTTKRQAGVEYVIADTDSPVLRELDMGRFKGEKFAGEKMPFLEEVLATVPPGKSLFIEIKCGQEILPVLEQILREQRSSHRIVIIGFNLETVSATKQKMPVIPVYWLIGRQKNKENPDQSEPLKPEKLEQAHAHGFNGVDLHFSAITEDVVRAAREMDLEVYAWTVNDPAEAKRLAHCGVKGFTTDRPGEFKSMRR